MELTRVGADWPADEGTAARGFEKPGGEGGYQTLLLLLVSSRETPRQAGVYNS